MTYCVLAFSPCSRGPTLSPQTKSHHPQPLPIVNCITHSSFRRSRELLYYHISGHESPHHDRIHLHHASPTQYLISILSRTPPSRTPFLAPLPPPPLPPPPPPEPILICVRPPHLCRLPRSPSAAVNIASSMHNRYSIWNQTGWH